MRNGDKAPHGPVTVPSAATACAAVPRPVAGSKYLAVAGTAGGDPPPVSGRRASEVVMVGASFLSAGDDGRP